MTDHGASDASSDPTGSKPSSLFVSYGRADSGRVRKLVAALSAAGYTVWWDDLIEAGDSFARRIEDKLDSADAVVVVWSATSVNSDWVLDEAAKGRDRRRLVPVTFDGCEPPLGFRQYQVVDLGNWARNGDRADFARFVRGVAATVSGEPHEFPVEIVSGRGFTRRKALIAGGVAAAAASGGYFVVDRLTGGAAERAVAVLPFANLSGDAEQDYFAQGLSEEIRAALVRVSALEVAAPTSSNAVMNSADDARSVASKLGVRFLLDGSVRKAGDDVRIDATFTDVSSGYASWTKRFDRKLDDIFALQSEIADAVTNAILAYVETSEKRPGGTEVVAAYDAYLRGRALFNSDVGEDSDRAALNQFDQAIALDSEFAGAHAARSRTLAAIASLHTPAEQIESTYGEAVESARTAVSLAPNLANAQLALGFALLNGFLDFKGAREAYDRARQYGRGDAEIQLMFAYFAAKSGRTAEALEVIAQAGKLDRLNARVFRAESQIRNGAGQYAKAIASASRALELSPDLSATHSQIGISKLQLGHPEDALEEFEKEPQVSVRLAGIAIAQQQLGKPAQAQEAFDQLVAELGDAAIYQQAEVLAQWGRTQDALSALDKAYAVRDGGITSIYMDPLLAPLRKEERYKALLARMGLVEIK